MHDNSKNLAIMDMYTMKQWESDRTLKVAVGQNIAPDVFFELLNSVPPQTYARGIFQAGEPYSHDWTTGKSLYSTFKHVADDEDGLPIYQYIGLQP